MTNDPRRLLDEGADDFEAKLLHAGRQDAPRVRSRIRILTGLGLGGLFSATAASGAKAQSWFSAGGIKTLGWIGGGAVSALAVWTGVEVMSPEVEPNLPAKVASAQFSPRAPSRAALPPTSPSVELDVAPIDSVSKSSTKKSARPQRSNLTAKPAVPETDTLSAELSALDQARSALVSRNTTLALRLLDDYERRFPKRRLHTEATVLRIETLAARGDRATASQLGTQFLAKHPNGPHARRVSTLIGDARSLTKAVP